jgi:hypothetical protein
MWIIIRTAKGKNSFLTRSGDWSKDRNDAERFDQFDYAVYFRDREIPQRERRGVGVVKFT